MSNEKGGISKEGITLPGETEENCCWFIPIKAGIYIIGIFMCLWAVNLILQCVNNINDYFMWGVLYGAAAAPIILGAYFYVRFFQMPDDKERRLGLQKACMLVILSAIASSAISLLQWMGNNAQFGYFL